MITQQPSQHKRKRKQGQHRRKPQHWEIALEHEHPLQEQAHNISKAQRKTPNQLPHTNVIKSSQSRRRRNFWIPGREFALAVRLRL
jgi:hypothetical protein